MEQPGTEVPDRRGPAASREPGGLLVMQAQALDDGDLERYLNLHGGEDRLDAFLRIAREIRSDALYWELLAETWCQLESPSRHVATWRSLLTASRDHRDRMMTAQERQALAAKPELLAVFRGVGHPDYAGGLSWTLDRERAVWFARRSATAFENPRPLLLTGVIGRADVIAFLTRRGEDEILVAPDAVAVSSEELLNV